jgi:glucosyl-dolichyl phosphate glucuronosyltransferase
MMTVDISVIVCAYTEDRWSEMLAAVDSLQRQTLPPREIILVIDHNAALLARSQQQFTGCTVIENHEQRGLSGARNSGLSIAQGEIVAFMDEDATAAANWLETLAAGYDDPAVLGVGGAIVPVWEIKRPSWFPDEFDWVVGCTYRGMPTTSTPVRNLIGCNMSFRRSVSEQIGGFRDGIGRVGAHPVGCEETEFCIRANQRFPGKHFLYVPEARVFHNAPASRANWDYFRARCYAEGLSKALIGRFIGKGDSLSSETSYATRTLPLGVLRGLAMLRPSGFARAAAIVVGLLTTTYGYASATVTLAREARAKRNQQPAALEQS